MDIRVEVAPYVYTRAEWDARTPSSPIEVIGPPDHIVIHHTASENTTDYSLEQASWRRVRPPASGTA